jgi:hypothetical protein
MRTDCWGCACVLLTHLLHCPSCVGNVYKGRVGFDIVMMWQTATDVSKRFGGRAESWDGVERAKRMTGNFSLGSVATVLSPSLFCLKPICCARLFGNSFAPVFDHSIKWFKSEWRCSSGCGCVSHVISSKLNDSVNLRAACKIDKPFRFAWYCNGNE